MEKAEFVRTVQDKEHIFDGLCTDIDPAELFIEASKVHPALTIAGAVHADDLEPSSPIHHSFSRSTKQYDACSYIELPSPDIPDIALSKVILTRCTEQKKMKPEQLKLIELSSILYSGYGITHEGNQEVGQLFRATPSAGALYPNDIYIVARQVEGLSQGLYHYNPFEHRLELLKFFDAQEFLENFNVYKDLGSSCSVSLLFVSSFWRSRYKYGLRAYRFAFLDAGHLAQNILLTANALGLAAIPVGGYYDQCIDDALNLDGVTESCIYTVALGRKIDESQQ